MALRNENTEEDTYLFQVEDDQGYVFKGNSGILNLDGIGDYGILSPMEGNTVTKEDVGDNGDGTYTWIYKVRSKPEGQ